VKSIYKLIIGLSLTALPALCGSFTINNTNATNTWYGFQWLQAGSSGTCGSSPTYPCGTIFGQANSTPSSDGTTTILGSGGLSVSGWAFDFTGPVTLTVTDLNTDGDSFKVYDNGNLILTTGASTYDGQTCQNNPATCVTDSFMSHGSVSVGAGANLITMVDLTVNGQSPSGSGAFELTGDVSTVSAVPEPASLGLMGLGLGGLLLGWRRKRA
jgi:PEP-CTERM motif